MKTCYKGTRDLVNKWLRELMRIRKDAKEEEQDNRQQTREKYKNKREHERKDKGVC